MQDNTYKIFTNIPIPDRKRPGGRPLSSKYPFSDLQVGQVAFIPGGTSKTVAGSVGAAKKRLGVNFTLRMLTAEEANELMQINESGVGVWRIENAE